MKDIYDLTIDPKTLKENDTTKKCEISAESYFWVAKNETSFGVYSEEGFLMFKLSEEEKDELLAKYEEIQTETAKAKIKLQQIKGKRFEKEINEQKKGKVIALLRDKTLVSVVKEPILFKHIPFELQADVSLKNDVLELYGQVAVELAKNEKDAQIYKDNVEMIESSHTNAKNILNKGKSLR